MVIVTWVGVAQSNAAVIECILLAVLVCWLSLIGVTCQCQNKFGIEIANESATPTIIYCLGTYSMLRPIQFLYLFPNQNDPVRGQLLEHSMSLLNKNH